MRSAGSGSVDESRPSATRDLGIYYRPDRLPPAPVSRAQQNRLCLYRMLLRAR